MVFGSQNLLFHFVDGSHTNPSLATLLELHLDQVPH